MSDAPPDLPRVPTPGRPPPGFEVYRVAIISQQFHNVYQVRRIHTTRMFVSVDGAMNLRDDLLDFCHELRILDFLRLLVVFAIDVGTWMDDEEEFSWQWFH